ncbi:FecR family protein [Pedobacter sp. UBA5917]|jgi:ferric-dicitrate binding protein FerR (iron transport regulator)|uniref:FecR family protein n=1 Tax=Pedobacter sp. UBA5917 TaxID=1947061 RepID=UPI0025D729F4|nr:FecR family protein [Pedobacter sp. UBA5917]
MSRNNIEDLLDRYLKKETTIQENELVEAWFAAQEQDQNEWHMLDKTARAAWLNELFGDIQTTIGENTGKVVVMKPKNNRLSRIISIAAVLVIAFGLLWQWPAIKQLFNPQELETLQVAADQKREIVLSDGSKIVINAGAEFKYPKTFDGKTREVYLSGEAYFDIKHDSSKPFIVHTGKVMTTVLGTAFDIKADQSSNAVVVTVTRGKVSVSDGKKLIGYITPGRQISYDVKKQKHIEKAADIAEVLSWQDTEIHFDDTTFAEAAKSLQQRFKINIAFANDKIKNCRFTGAALKGKNINQILKVICAFNNATFRYDKAGSIIIEGKGCD